MTVNDPESLRQLVIALLVCLAMAAPLLLGILVYLNETQTCVKHEKLFCQECKAEYRKYDAMLRKRKAQEPNPTVSSSRTARTYSSSIQLTQRQSETRQASIRTQHLYPATVGGYVYSITNTKTGMVYVGSSVDKTRRWSQHTSQLSSGQHVNQMLQRDWRYFGEDAFVFNVLQEVHSITRLADEEQRWIDHYIDELGLQHLYNVQLTVRSRPFYIDIDEGP